VNEEQYAQLVKKILTELPTPLLITLYVGAAPSESVHEEIFQGELEDILFNDRDVRAPDDVPSEGFWHLNSLDDEEVEELGSYFEDCLPDYLQRWVELMEKLQGLFVSQPGLAIKEVSFIIGFYSPRSFGRTVKRACGFSPQELRSYLVNELKRTSASAGREEVSVGR
jgi:AraC-like DNA-binding protein